MTIKVEESDHKTVYTVNLHKFQRNIAECDF